MAAIGKSQPKVSTPSNVTTASKPTPTTTNTPSLCKPVVVVWHDAAVSVGWDEGKSDARVETVTSIGWLLASSDTEVVLGADISTDTEGHLQTNRRIAIPARWITSLKEITL